MNYNFNDQDIINTVKKDLNYEIKTTSQMILNQYNENQAIKKQKRHLSKKVKYSLFGVGSLALVAAASLALVFIFHNNSNVIDTPKIQIKNKHLENELVSFSLFVDSSSSDLNNVRARNARLNELNNETNEEYFKSLVDNYDKYNLMIKDSKKEIVCEAKVFDNYIDDKYFKYMNEISFKGDNESLSRIYFNDEDIFSSNIDDNFNNQYQALYVTDNKIFNMIINKTVERSHNELEIEYSSVFVSLDQSEVFKVENEKEIELNEKEYSYSLSTYSSLDNLNLDNYLEKVEYEFENEDNENEEELVVYKNNEEFHYENIIHSTNITAFDAYKEINNIEQDNYFIKLEYKNSNRIYSYSNYQYIK